MFEYHGWLTIYGSSDDSLVEEREAEEAIAYLCSELSKTEGRYLSFADVRAINDQHHFSFSGHRNHRTGSEDELLELVARVADMARGSYGLIYLRDSEDEHGRDNEFQVLAIRRGVVHVESDTLLSPVVPRLDDGIRFVDGDPE